MRCGPRTPIKVHGTAESGAPSSTDFAASRLNQPCSSTTCWCDLARADAVAILRQMTRPALHTLLSKLHHPGSAKICSKGSVGLFTELTHERCEGLDFREVFREASTQASDTSSCALTAIGTPEGDLRALKAVLSCAYNPCSSIINVKLSFSVPKSCPNRHAVVTSEILPCQKPLDCDAGPVRFHKAESSST